MSRRRPFRSTPMLLAVVALAIAAAGSCSRREHPRVLDGPQSIPADALAGLPLPDLAFDDPIPPDAPRRIVCVVPSATEILFALGLGDRIVGRSDWCDWPPAAATRPALGNQQSLSVERIADLRPDLVVFWAHLPDKKDRLTGLFRLKVVTPGTESRAEILDGMRLVAQACGVAGRGERLVRHLEDGLAALSSRCSRHPRVRALVVLDRNQAFFLPGRESFLQELFDVCNIENVAASLDAGRWPSVSIETILQWNPEMVVDLSLGAAPSSEAVLQGRAFWARHASLDAVRRGRVVVLDAGVLVRPGPRLLAAAQELARIVHGAA